MQTSTSGWVLPCPDLLPLGQWKEETLQAASFFVLADVHLLPENGVLEAQGQQTGSEVNVRFPCQEQDLWVHYRVTAGQTPTLLTEPVGR